MKRFQSLAAVAALVFLTLGASNVSATSVLPLDLDRITADAQDIVHVRCTGNTVQPDAAVGVVTVTTFTVLDRAKGPQTSALTVRQPGGERDGIAIDYRVPKFEVGAEYVLFMPAPSRWGLASPVGLSQGAFSVVHGRAGREVGNGRDIAALLSSNDRAAATGSLAARLSMAPSERSRMGLEDFMALVRAKAARK